MNRQITISRVSGGRVVSSNVVDLVPSSLGQEAFFTKPIRSSVSIEKDEVEEKPKSSTTVYWVIGGVALALLAGAFLLRKPSRRR